MMNMKNNVTAIKVLWHNKPAIEKTFLLTGAFSILLLAVRIVVTGSLMFGFLPWNLLLAYVPYAITRRLTREKGEKIHRLKFIMMFSLWLLFLPNSFYIITDLFHLNQGKAPKWFNLVLIFSFAWNGLLLGIISLRQMGSLIEPFISIRWRCIFLYLVMGLNALGIYIGRYLRFNSWDVITNPFQLAGDIVYLAVHPVRNMEDWGMIVCYAILMLLVYQGIERMSRTSL